MTEKGAASDALLEKAKNILSQRAARAVPGSREEYQLALLGVTITAYKRGDYAIGAIAAVRERGYELLSVGANTIFTESNPRGHAESNAIANLVEMGKPGASKRRAWASWPKLQDLPSYGPGLYLRKLDEFEDPAKSILYTTLEPCPMCTVITLTAGISRAVIGAEDYPSGAMGKMGELRMPPVFLEIAKAGNFRMEYMDSEVPVTGEITALLGELFFASRAKLDGVLGVGGLLELYPPIGEVIGRI